MKKSYLIKSLTGAFVFFCILFISAGRVDYGPAWVYVAIGSLMIVLSNTVLRMDDRLLEERAKPGEGTKKWDKALLGLFSIATICMYVVAGLDSGRWHWSPPFHPSLYVVGAVLTFCGQLLFLIAQKQNRFFSSTVRIQKDRGHVVCSRGLYSVIRHPGYCGSLIQIIGFPLLFGSLWSIVPVAVLVILFIVRTKLEDQTLQAELQGYREYAAVTRYKIIPGIW